MSKGTKVPSHARCHFCKRGNKQSGGLSLKSNLDWTEDRWYCRNTQDCINVRSGGPKVPDRVGRNNSRAEAEAALGSILYKRKAVA